MHNDEENVGKEKERKKGGRGSERESLIQRQIDSERDRGIERNRERQREREA